MSPTGKSDSVRSVRACVRASEAVCARERAFFPPARVRELQIDSGAVVAPAGFQAGWAREGDVTICTACLPPRARESERESEREERSLRSVRFVTSFLAAPFPPPPPQPPYQPKAGLIGIT